MKKSILKLIFATICIGFVCSQFIYPTISYTTLFSDDFESYANTSELGIVWNVDSGTTLSTNFAHSGVQSVRFYDNTVDDLTDMYRAISDTTFAISLSFWVMPRQTNGFFEVRFDGMSGDIVWSMLGIRFAEDGCYTYGKNAESSGIGYSKNNWHYINILYYVADHKMTITVNSTYVICTNTTTHPIQNVGGIIFQTGVSHGSAEDIFYLDDVEFSYIPRPEVIEQPEDHTFVIILACVFSGAILGLSVAIAILIKKGII